MGYFDYLETKSAVEIKDNAYIEAYSKVALYIHIGTIAISLVSILVFCFVQIGSVVWLDILVAVGIIAGIFAMAYSNSVRSVSKRRHKKNALANFILVWSLFFVLINVIIFVMNTWLYFL